jgi:hypothetical protein
MSSRMGHGSSQVLKILPAFREFCGRALFVRGLMEPYLFSGPVEAEGGTSVLSRQAGPSGIPWHTLSLVKKTLHRHRVGFEPQRASSFMKSAKASQIFGEAVRA